MYTITTLSELNYFNNWSAEFHTQFTNFKELVKSNKALAIKNITEQIELSKFIANSHTIADNQSKEHAFGSTIVNKAIAIIKGDKPFIEYTPTLLVALLYILDLILDKEILNKSKQKLLAELHNLNLILSQLESKE